MDNEKKEPIFLSGTVQLPLKIGEFAMITDRERVFLTMNVAAIQQYSEDMVIFETQKNVYCVSPPITPMPRDAGLRLVLCA